MLLIVRIVSPAITLPSYHLLIAATQILAQINPERCLQIPFYLRLVAIKTANLLAVTMKTVTVITMIFSVLAT